MQRASEGSPVKQKLRRKVRATPTQELVRYGFVKASERANARRMHRVWDRAAAVNRLQTAHAEPAPAHHGGLLTMSGNDLLHKAGIHVPLLDAASRDVSGIITGLPKVPYDLIVNYSKYKRRGEPNLLALARASYDTSVVPNVQFAKQLARHPIGTFEQYPVSTALFGLAAVDAGAGTVGVASRLARAGEYGGVRGAIRAGRVGPTREVHGVQFPQSPSPTMRAMQRAFDRASATPHLDNMMGRSLGPFSPSASVRAAKQVERHFRQASRRTDAEYERDVQYLDSLEGPARQAAFWSAQVPNSVRDQALGRLEHVNRTMAGQVRDLAEQELAKEAPNARTHAKLISQAADLTRTAEEIKVARQTPHDLRAEEAIGRLMQHRTEILTAAGKVKPEDAQLREGLLARSLGYEDPNVLADLQDQRNEIAANLDDMSKQEKRAAKRDLAKLDARLATFEGKTLVDDFSTAGFVGHRSPGRTLLQRTLGRGTDVSTGTPLPRGVGHRNELKLLASGRINADPAQIVKDWRAARVYEYHNNVRRYLSGIGEPIDAEKGVKPGYMIVNPEGKGLPRHVREADPGALAAGEGITPALYANIEDTVRNYLPQAADAARLLREFPREVKQVPAAVVRRLVGHYDNVLTGKRPGKLEAGTDIASDLVRASFIHFNPGYVPANLIGNMAFLAAGEGVRAAPNLLRATRLRTTLKPRNVELAHRIRAEVGQGPTAAATSGGRNVVSRGLHVAANVIGEIPDVQPRMASWMAQARRVGITSESSQLDLLRGAAQGDPGAIALANEIRDRMNVNMVDFDRSGPTERYLGRKFGFVYPWIRGAARYPFRFAADHPIRSAVFANAARNANEKYQLPYVPRWLQGSFAVGPVNGRVAHVINPRVTSTVSTPLDVLTTLSAAVQGGQGAALADLANPVLGAGARVLTGRSRYGADVGAKGAALEFVGGVSPLYNFTRELADPGRSPKVYGPQDRWEVLRRRLMRGSVPMKVDLREAWKEGRDAVPPTQRVVGDWHFFRQDAGPLAAKLGIPADQLNHAIQLSAARNAARAKEHERLGRKLTSKEGLDVDLKLAVKLGLLSQQQADATSAQIATIPDSSSAILGRVTSGIGAMFGTPVLGGIDRGARNLRVQVAVPRLVR